MNPDKLQNLIYMRQQVLSDRQQDSPQQEEIFKKLDELILAELNKSDTPTATEPV